MTPARFIRFEKKMKFDAPATAGALCISVTTVYAYRTGDRTVPPWIVQLIRYILKFGILQQ